MSTRAWISFASVSFLWGIPYLFIKVAVDDGISPAFLAWARVALGALVLLLILAGSWLSTDGRLPPGLGATVERWLPRDPRPTEG